MNLLEMIASQANNPQANPLVRRLAQHAIGTQQGHDFGSVPVLSGAAETATHPAMAAAAQLGLLLEAAQTAGKAGLGGAYIGAGRFGQSDAGRVVGQRMPLLAKLGDLGFGAMAQQAANAPQEPGANPIERALAAHEAAASGHEFASFLADSLTDPTNYLGGLGKLTEGTRLAKVGEVLGAVDRAQGLPVEKAGQRIMASGPIRSLMESLAAQRAAREALTTISERGNVKATDLIQGVGTEGRRGLGPLLPALQDVPLPPELGPAFPERGNLPGDQLIPGIGRKGGLGIGPPAPAPAVQPVADLLGAGRKTAQPSALEGLLGAARGAVGRNVAPVTPIRSIAEIERAIPKVGQFGLPAESGVIPADLQRLGLDKDQFDFLDELRGTVRRGKQQEIGAARTWATDVLGIPAERVARTLEDAYQALDVEDRAARIAAIEGSPYFEAFQYFKKNGEIKPTNPTNGARIKGVREGGDEIWNLPGSGYDEVADAILARYQVGGHNQNYGQSAEDFWYGARDAFKEYQALKRPAVAAIGEIGADLPNVSPAVPKAIPPVTNLLPPEAVTPVEEAAAKAAGSVADLAEPLVPDFPALTGTRRELLAGLSRTDLSRLVSTAYNDVPRAIGNARNARPDPVDLAERAIERITGNNKLVQRLQQRAPDLAAWVAELPESEISAIADESVQAAQQLGGDIAAGDTDKLLPYAGGLGAANRAIGGALAGGAVGGVTGALAEPDDRLGGAAKGATIGALAGGNVGAASPLMRHLATRVIADPATWGKRAEGRLLADPEILADTLNVVKRAGSETKTGTKGLQEVWNAFAAQWKRQAVDTAKQLPQDATYRATVIEGIAREEFGLGETDARQFQRAVSREKATGAISLDDPYNQLLIQSGHADLLTLKGDLIGADFTEAVTGAARRNPETGVLEQGAPRFTRLGSAIAGSVIGMGSALKSVNPVSPIFGAVRGLVDTEWSAGLHHLIGVANDSWREAMANAGTRRRLASVADDFLAKLEANGVDTAALQGRGGLFSGDEVAAIAGRQAGDDWHTLGETTIRQVGDRVATIAGDFRDKLAKDYTGTVTSGDRLLGQAERAAGKFAPFARWQIRSTPVLLEVAARHPVATFKALQETQRLGEEAKAEGKRGYQAGYDITTETPLLGAAARVRLGGKKGTWTVNPIKALVPYADTIGGGEEMPDDATAYQRVAQLLGGVGLGPSPLIQTGAYVAGQDYRAPGSLSRTAGLEGLGALLPGVGDMKLPTGRTLLDAARGVVEPALADAGIATTGSASASDPVARRYAELVFDKTGKPLADKSMIHYLTRDTPEAQALMRQAVREEALMGAAGNVASLTSPIPSTAQGADAAAAQAARKPVIEAQDLVETLPPVQGALLQRRIDQYKAAHPESRVYDGTSARAQAQLLMADWERRHATLAWFPEIYDYQRQIAAEELGLVRPGTLARKQRALAEAGKSAAAPGLENRLRLDPGGVQRLRELRQVRP